MWQAIQAPAEVLFSFFFLMIRRPPRSTLFPYTRSSDLSPPASSSLRSSIRTSILPSTSAVRSEEHTSELQSRFELVCRLLLEKKKISSENHSLQPEAAHAGHHQEQLLHPV